METDYRAAIERLGLETALAAYDPRIAGTLPLGIGRPDSDIDVLCHAPDAQAFAHDVWSAFGNQTGFSMRQWTGDERPVIASFRAHGWPFEIFGHPSPVSEQRGWRHFTIERRLLELGGKTFQRAIRDRRAEGTKTEPAFAGVLGLSGDPYLGLLEIAADDDGALAALLAANGFSGA
jgi:hypothetical protein